MNHKHVHQKKNALNAIPIYPQKIPVTNVIPTLDTELQLKVHIVPKHKGVCYPCEKCDYISNIEVHLKVHIESKHEGVQYACDKWEYKDSIVNGYSKGFIMHITHYLYQSYINVYGIHSI